MWDYKERSETDQTNFGLNTSYMVKSEVIVELQIVNYNDAGYSKYWVRNM